MVAGPVAERLTVVVVESGEHEQVFPIGRQSLQGLRKIEGFAIGLGRPMVHDDAVRDITERHPVDGRRRRPCRVRQRRNHGVEQRQAERRAKAAQQRAPIECFLGDDHRSGVLLI